MTKLTKKQKTLQEKYDSNKVYSIEEAMEIIQSVKSNNFDESIDISVKLGVDPNKSDQNVRGAVTLPNSLGKEVIVAVFADGDKASEAEAIKNVKAGQVRFRTDKNGIIHGSIGRVSFDGSKIKANAVALLEELKKLKPASAKGIYIGNIALSSTMGPGVKISSGDLI